MFRINQSNRKTAGILFAICAYFLMQLSLLDRVENYMQKKEMEKLLGYASSYAWIFEQMAHHVLNDKTSTQDLLYLKLIDYEKGWLKNNPAIADIYTMKKNKDGHIVFIVASETDYNKNNQIDETRKHQASIGKPLEKQIPELNEAFLGKATFTHRPYANRLGSWVSAFVPLYHNGKVDGVLALDFPADSYLKHIAHARLLVLVCSILFLTTLLGGGVAWYRQQQYNKALNEDLSKSKKLAALKSEFLANVSHEIRTPLNGILGMLSLMSDEPVSIEVKRQIEIMRNSADSLVALINDVLDLSKIEAGKVELELVTFNVRIVIEEALALFSALAKEKDVDVSLTILPEGALWIKMDLNRFRQVLINLVSNAIKFTSEGAVTVVVSVVSENLKNVELRIDVKDTGIGIAKKTQDKLFQSFTQADASTTRKFGGTGLGLSICKGLVEAMGGKIWVESVEGQGTTFSFTLLAERETEPQTKIIKEDHAVLPMARAKPLRILVADDHSTNQLLAQRFLEKIGYKADAVSNGLQVLDALGTKAYDVIFLDCHMPEMDGFTVMQKLKTRYSNRNRPWVVALTASAMKEDQEKCLASGMNDFVAKPFNTKSLAQALERVKKQDIKIYDYKRMARHFDGDDELIATFIKEYLKRAMPMRKMLRTSIEARAAEQLRLHAHTFYGAIVNFFAASIEHDLKVLETMGKENNLADAATLYSSLEQKLEQLDSALSENLERKAS